MNIFCLLFENASVIIKMAWLEFNNKFRRSYMGHFWSLMYPFTTVLVLWFIFTQAFKAQADKDGTPFIIWLLAGMAVWHFFAEALSTATQAITGNAYMLKKRSFNLILLPCIRVVAALFSHCTFLALVFCLYLYHGVYPNLFWLQLPYYMLCTMAIAIGLGFITSSLSVFAPDVEHGVTVFLQLFFWVTPVFWSLSMIPPRLGAVLALNPVVYLVQGYRNALLGQGWFWQEPTVFCIFWVMTVIIFFAGYTLFNRSKAHFADVL